jgi:tRNA-specific 2-thiouridylase
LTYAPTALVGLSGGVDSSVAALLLKQRGYRVIGLFMQNWADDDTEEYCSSRQDLIDAVAVADRLGIDIEAVNFVEEYRERVFRHFLDEYAAGRTPNPDILCNSEIKFRAFLEYAMSLGADHIATGHYAGVREVNGHYELLKAEDGTKDQSYFLCRLNQAQLAKTLFPLAELHKTEVRRIAAEHSLPTATKKDSTGICFIGERKFRAFLERYLPRSPGPMVTPEGAVIGEHIGLPYYTIGQRQGIGVGGQRGSSGEPWFVVAKDIPANALIVVQGHEHPLLHASSLRAADAHWIGGESPRVHWVYGAKTRYRQTDAPCSLSRIDGGEFTVNFAAPQFAVTPGQSVVVYESRVCLGSGVIQAAT